MYDIAVLASQWIGAFFILLGMWKMATRTIVAPLLIIIGGLSMLIFGVLVQAWGVVAVNAVAVVLNWRCWRRWKSDGV